MNEMHLPYIYFFQNFIFKDYQDYSLFEDSLLNKLFNFSEAKTKYINNNEKYILPYFEPENSQAIISSIIYKSKNSDLLRQYFESEDPDFDVFNSYQRALLFYEQANDIIASIKHLGNIIISNEESSVSQLISSKAIIYFDIYEKAGKREQAYNNLEMLLAKNPDFELELKFILSKIGLENKIQVEKSKKYLKQVEKTFRANKLFDKNDLEKLKMR